MLFRSRRGAGALGWCVSAVPGSHHSVCLQLGMKKQACSRLSPPQHSPPQVTLSSAIIIPDMILFPEVSTPVTYTGVCVRLCGRALVSRLSGSLPVRPERMAASTLDTSILIVFKESERHKAKSSKRRQSLTRSLILHCYLCFK